MQGFGNGATRLGSGGAGEGAEEGDAIDMSAGDEAHAWNFDGDLPHLVEAVQTGQGVTAARPMDLSGENAEGEDFELQPSYALEQVELNSADLVRIAREVLEQEFLVMEKKKHEFWRKVLKNVQAPPSPFDRIDLEWESKVNQGKGNKTDTCKATIPWD